MEAIAYESFQIEFGQMTGISIAIWNIEAHARFGSTISARLRGQRFDDGTLNANKQSCDKITEKRESRVSMSIVTFSRCLTSYDALNRRMSIVRHRWKKFFGAKWTHKPHGYVQRYEMTVSLTLLIQRALFRKIWYVHRDHCNTFTTFKKYIKR